jgi:hypothetical protein
MSASVSESLLSPPTNIYRSMGYLLQGVGISPTRYGKAKVITFSIVIFALKN